LAVLTDAFASLENNNAVLGPSLDGGYYLVDMNQVIADIFAGIIWSQANILTLTNRKTQHAQ